MFPRIASLLQIALLLGCPCWCRADLCASAGHCCRPSGESTLPAEAAEPISTERRCCRTKQCAADKNRESKAPAPGRDSPSEPPSTPCECQCICGGAVLGEPVVSGSSADVRDLPLPVIEPLPHRGAVEISSYSKFRGLSFSGACTGRELRHLIASLIC